MGYVILAIILLMLRFSITDAISLRDDEDFALEVISVALNGMFAGIVIAMLIVKASAP